MALSTVKLVFLKAFLMQAKAFALCFLMPATSVATDDRKAINVARRAGLAVLSCPELVKAWARATKADVTLVKLNLLQICHFGAKL